jgi:hypothetical protein
VGRVSTAVRAFRAFLRILYGEAVPKAAPTWIHGFLQIIIGNLLIAQGYKAGSEVELRIDPSAFPKLDVIATKGPIETPYPTHAVEVVVEILF